MANRPREQAVGKAKPAPAAKQTRALDLLRPAEEAVIFYFTIGHALTRWAHVEQAVLETLIFRTTRHEFNTLGREYFETVGFRARLRFIDEQLRPHLPDEAAIADWTRLKRRASSAAVLRNRLAHWQVIVSAGDDVRQGRRYLLQPWLPVARAHQGLGVRDVDRYRSTFVAVMFSLFNFTVRLRGERPPHPPEAEVPQSPLTLAALRAQALSGVRASPQA